MSALRNERPPVHQLFVALLGGVLLLPAAVSADRYDRLAAWIETELTGDESPSLAVAVAREGRIVWAEGFGYADKERRLRATADTRYSVASVSKPITATALMLLAERGAIDLDRPINDYLGDARLAVHVGSSAAVTVRRVASHSAGLAIHHHFFVEGQRAPPSMSETIHRYGHVVSAPGRFQYSNLGYGVLGYLVERRSGQSLAAFMREEIFQPLGMSRTSLGLAPDERHDYAVRYGRDGRPLPYYEFDHEAASGVFSSARDLARFGLLHAERPADDTRAILTWAGIRAMQRPAAGRENGTSYGIGWQIREDRHSRIISHGGGMPGVTTLLTIVPASRLVVVALANASSSLPSLVTERLLADLAPAAMRPTGAASASGPRRATRQRPARRVVGSWSGHIETRQRQIALSMRIRPDGVVLARIDAGPESPLVNVRFDQHEVRGWLRDARLPTPDAASASVLQVVVSPHPAGLRGWVTAYAGPDRADGFALSHWAELAREP